MTSEMILSFNDVEAVTSARQAGWGAKKCKTNKVSAAIARGYLLFIHGFADPNGELVVIGNGTGYRIRRQIADVK